MKQNFGIKILAIALLALLTIGFFSCKSENKDAYHSFNGARQNGIGEIDDIVVVCNNTLWNTALRDTFEYYFNSPYLLLPQPESIFHTKQFSYKDVLEKPLRKKFLTMLVMADMSDTTSRETKMVLKDLGQERIQELLSSPVAGFAIAKNKWVDKQLIIYLVGDSQEDLERAISVKFPAIAAKIHQHDQSRIHRRVFYNGKNKGSMKLIADTFGIQMQIPPDFIASKVRNQELIWIRKETDKTSSNLMVVRIPYTNQKQLNPDSLKAYVNAIGKKYVASRTPGSYMVVNDQDLPLIKNKVNFDGHYVIENRGIWELENDFMGGPFVAYLMPNPSKKNELLMLIGFVYAPQKEKKSYVEDLEEIIRTIDLGQ